jgi:hypothetical protein
MIATQFTARHRSMLRAVADGRGQIIVMRVANLSVDGRWCDFSASNDLVAGGLVRPAWPAPPGTATPAVLTSAGIETLAVLAG